MSIFKYKNNSMCALSLALLVIASTMLAPRSSEAASTTFFPVDAHTDAIFEFNGNVKDSSGNGRDATLINPDSTYTTGVYGQGLALPDEDDVAQGIDWSPYKQLLVPPYTVEALVYPEDVSEYARLFTQDDDDDNGLYYKDGSLVNYPDDPLEGVSLAPNTLHCLAWAAPASPANVLNLYLNGEYLGQVERTYGEPDIAHFFMDNSILPYTNENIHGYVDSMRISNVVRSDEELAADCAAANSGESLAGVATTSLVPADNATGISRGANLTIAFNQTMTIGSGNILIKKTSDNSTVETIDVTSGKVTGGGTDTITIDPDSILSGSTSYYVTIPDTAFEGEDGDFYGGMSATTTWNFTTAPAEALGGGLVAYWKFDETTGGGEAIDSSTSGYHGTPSGTGGPQPSTTIKAPTSFNNPASLYFDGVDDYLDLPDGFADFTNGMTITMWARPTAANSWARFFDFGNGSAADNIIIARNGGSDNFYYEAYRQGDTRKTSVIDPPIELNEWHYYTVTMNPVSPGSTDSVVQVYVDGVLASMDTTTGYVPRNIIRTSNYIGRSNWNDPYYQGYIDDLRIYDRALAPEEVSTLSEGDDLDITAPVITNVFASAIADDGATFGWTTNEDASSKVVYGLTDSYGTATTETDTSSRVMSHSVGIDSLLPCTVYHYAVVSRDAALNESTSDDAVFTTSGCAGDAVPTAQDSEDITVSSGGDTDVVTAGKTFTVSIPPAVTTASGSLVIQIKAISSASALSSIGKPSTAPNVVGASVFDVKAIINGDTILDSFDAPVTIEYAYTDQEIANLEESTLKLYHYTGGQWVALDGCSVSSDTNTISCTTPSFSVFGLFGVQKAIASSGGYIAPGAVVIPPPQPVASAVSVSSDVCTPYIKSYIQLGAENDPGDVKKLQTFLNDKQGEQLPVDGVYSASDAAAVMRFQQKYASEVLGVWGLSKPTGYVYRTTLMKINSFYCNGAITCPAFAEYNSLAKNPVSPEVLKTKTLMNELGFYSGPLDTVFDKTLDSSLKKFQETFSATMLKPWGLTKGTGYKYKTTNKFLNMLVGCETSAVNLDGRGSFDY